MGDQSPHDFDLAVAEVPIAHLTVKSDGANRIPPTDRARSVVDGERIEGSVIREIRHEGSAARIRDRAAIDHEAGGLGILRQENYAGERNQAAKLVTQCSNQPRTIGYRIQAVDEVQQRLVIGCTEHKLPQIRFVTEGMGTANFPTFVGLPPYCIYCMLMSTIFT